MKLIIECDSGLFAYRETEKVFKRNEKHRKNKLPLKALDNDCNLSNYYGYFVVNLTKKKSKRRGTSLDK